MTTITLPNVGLTAGFLPGENGWSPAMNKMLRMVDALMQARVLDKDLTVPPGAPASGDLYIVGPAATGAWAGQAGKLALWQAGDDLTAVWLFITPKAGWRVFVVDESTRYQYSGTVWAADTSTFSSFSMNIGDASAATFTIAHNLGSRNVHVAVYRNAAPYDEVVVDVARTDANNVQISGFAIAPALNQFTVYVSK